MRAKPSRIRWPFIDSLKSNLKIGLPTLRVRLAFSRNLCYRLIHVRIPNVHLPSPTVKLRQVLFELFFKLLPAETNSVASIPIQSASRRSRGPATESSPPSIAKTVNPIRTMTSRFALRILLRRDVFMPDKSS